MYSVTSAPLSLRDDQHYRMVRYLVSMGIRTICFVVGVIFVAVLHWTVIGWICLVAAAVLPYIAVVMANAKRAGRFEEMGSVTPTGNVDPQLPPGHTPREDHP